MNTPTLDKLIRDCLVDSIEKLNQSAISKLQSIKQNLECLDKKIISSETRELVNLLLTDLKYQGLNFVQQEPYLTCTSSTFGYILALFTIKPELFEIYGNTNTFSIKEASSLVFIKKTVEKYSYVTIYESDNYSLFHEWTEYCKYVKLFERCEMLAIPQNNYEIKIIDV